jgi:hypothetical protein
LAGLADEYSVIKEWVAKSDEHDFVKGYKIRNIITEATLTHYSALYISNVPHGASVIPYNASN